jgi:hypothetical protein
LPLKENAANELAIIIETLNQRIWMVPALLLVAAGLSLLSGWNVLRGDVRRSVMNVALFSLVGIVAVQGIVSPALAAAQSYKEFVQAAKQSILGQETLTIFAKGLDVSSLVFYGGKNVKILHTDYEGLRRYFEQSKDYVVMGEAEWKEFREVYLPVPVIIHGRGSGPDGDDPLVLVRPSPPPLP